MSFRINPFSLLSVIGHIGPDAEKLVADVKAVHDNPAVQAAAQANPTVKAAFDRVNTDVANFRNDEQRIKKSNILTIWGALARTEHDLKAGLDDISTVFTDPSVHAAVQADAVLGPFVARFSADLRALEDDASALGVKV